mmetsp:Transcript_34640/g.59687  ORF Transcript_34640/g.59687 Transcript_34640/m.59687 type:complete len:381 (-) Transcript_34640:1079-2221(-)
MPKLSCCTICIKCALIEAPSVFLFLLGGAVLLLLLDAAIGSFNLQFGLSFGPVLQVVVVGRQLHQPLQTHHRHRANVVTRGEHELLEQHPGRLGVEHRGRVDGDHLVVLHRQVVALLLQVSHLHEQARSQAAANVRVVVRAAEVRAHQRQLELLHDALQLVAHVLHANNGAVVDEIVPAPVLALSVLHERVVSVEHRQVVAIHVGELSLGLVSGLGCFLGAHEDVRHTQQRHDAEHLVAALVVRGDQEHLGLLGLQRHLAHHVTQRGHRTLVVQGAQIVQLLQGTHHRFRRRRIHKVEVHQVLDAQLQQGQHHRLHARPQDLRVCLHLQLVGEGPLRVQTETLSGTGTTRTTRSLLRRSLRNRRHQQTFHSNTRIEHLLF